MSAQPPAVTTDSGPPRLPLPPPAHEAPLPAARETASGVRVFGGVAYAAMPGIRPLELDLWIPAGEGPFPAVLYLHGGGWRLGSRRSAGPAYVREEPGPFEAIAQAGIAVASADYRLSGEATWPIQVHDAKAAVRWLRSRADEIGIDPKRIAAWGESAGGHLAELLGFTAGDADLEGAVGASGQRSDVTAVVAWYAPSDLTSVTADAGLDPSDPTTREAQLLGAPPLAAPDLAAEASPITYVSAAAPPTLLLHGRADRFIPSVQSERLGDALADAGADVAVHFYDNADHMWIGNQDAARDAVERTIEFLRQHLGDEAKSTGDKQ